MTVSQTFQGASYKNTIQYKTVYLSLCTYMGGKEKKKENYINTSLWGWTAVPLAANLVLLRDCQEADSGQ